MSRSIHNFYCTKCERDTDQSYAYSNFESESVFFRCEVCEELHSVSSEKAYEAFERGSI
jgi:hypothetical protein